MYFSLILALEIFCAFAAQVGKAFINAVKLSLKISEYLALFAKGVSVKSAFQYPLTSPFHRSE